jgi:hypothetical protein
LIQKHNLLEKFQQLGRQTVYPLPPDLRLEYNNLNAIRHSCVKQAEKKCRKLRMGQDEFSPAIQSARTEIYAWSLLLRKAEGKKISSRLLALVLKKAKLPTSARGLTPQTCREYLKASQSYFSLRRSAPALRAQHLESLASAWADHGNTTKEKYCAYFNIGSKLNLPTKKLNYYEENSNVTVQRW